MINIRIFVSENFQFLEVKVSIYLNRRVFVMILLHPLFQEGHSSVTSKSIYNQNSSEGGVAPAGAKVTGAIIRPWLLNKFISFLAVLSWKSDKN